MKPGENLKALRIAEGMTQAEIARAIQAPVATVRAYESGKKDMTAADRAMAARLFHGLEADDLLDPDLTCRVAEPNRFLLEEAGHFADACGLHPGYAVAAMETQRVSVDPDPAHPDGTRWVPSLSTKGSSAEWRKELMRMRFLGGFAALYPESSRPSSLASCLDDPRFGRAVAEAAYLQDVSEWDRDDLALLTVLARLYVAYGKACIDPETVTCTQAEQAINDAMLVPPRHDS